ncbi:MAG: ABC transporter ATP-binding protein [Planctomycetota bacterium]|nr:MAG: ABC transporter ATP-binding protein [Planctomycetota bacterium]
MTAPALRCVNLSRWYGEVQGLSGLTVDMHGGVIGLLGPNGSGKTTLMRLLTGLAEPSSGYAEIFGVRMGSQAHDLFRRIGHAPGDDIHFENERAVDFLRLLARLGGETGATVRQLADRALDHVGLLDRGDTRLKAMSKGMRQRIKVAQALLFEPELLLLDEPLNGMDPLSRRQIMDLVRRHGSQGGTVVFASHILHEVEAVTDQVVMLHHGRLLAEGRLSEIRDLLSQKPRRVTLNSPARRSIAASLLEEEAVRSVAFGEGDELSVETRDLDGLVARLQSLGAEGQVQSLQIMDENLEAVFDLLVGGWT